MLHQEIKYQVSSFAPLEQFFASRQIYPSNQKTTHHYYGRHAGKDVLKLVSYEDKHEIHELKETNGHFDLLRSFAVKDVKAGLDWLKEQGYEWVDLVKMTSRDYSFQGGLVRLYLIDDWSLSAILDYKAGQHEAVAKELGLDGGQIIVEPYNKYLQKIGKLREMEL